MDDLKESTGIRIEVMCPQSGLLKGDDLFKVKIVDLVKIADQPTQLTCSICGGRHGNYPSTVGTCDTLG